MDRSGLPPDIVIIALVYTFPGKRVMLNQQFRWHLGREDGNRIKSQTGLIEVLWVCCSSRHIDEVVKFNGSTDCVPIVKIHTSSVPLALLKDIVLNRKVLDSSTHEGFVIVTLNCRISQSEVRDIIVDHDPGPDVERVKKTIINRKVGCANTNPPTKPLFLNLPGSQG